MLKFSHTTTPQVKPRSEAIEKLRIKLCADLGRIILELRQLRERKARR